MNLINDFKAMSGMDKFGQIVSIPLNLFVIAVSLATGWWGYAIVFVCLIYLNWVIDENSFASTLPDMYFVGATVGKRK